MIIAAHTMPLRAIPIEFLLWSEPRGRPRSSGRDRLCRLGRFMNPGLVDWGKGSAGADSEPATRRLL